MKTTDNISNINGGCITSDMLVKYIKGELSGAERNRIERHLASCEMCSDELEGLSLLDDLDGVGEVERELNSNVDEVLEMTKVVKAGWSLYLRIAASILLLVGTSSVIFYVSFRTPKQEMTSESFAFDIAAPSEIKDSSRVFQPKIVAGIAKVESQELAYREATSKRAERLKSKEEGKESSDRYLAPVVADSITEDVKDSERLTSGMAIAANQIAAEAYAPAKAESEEKNKPFLRSAVSASGISTGSGSKRISAPRSSSRKRLAFKLYFEENYREALLPLVSLNTDFPENDSVQFYTSMCYFNLNQTERSIEGLDNLSRKPNSLFFNDAQWYYALSLIRIGLSQRADSVLRSVVDGNTKYTEEALKKLEEIKR